MNDSEKIIVTHDARFHTDDVFAVATLLLFLEKQNKTASVIRTRDTLIASNADYVVDVGGEYDDKKNRFDHHQEGGAGKRENGIPFASFGLVWKKYGKDLCGSEKVASSIDSKLVQQVDATDNGIEISKTIFENVYPYEIADIVEGAFNPSWKEGFGDIDNIFIKIVFFAKDLISREIKRTGDKFEAEEIVVDIYKKTEDKRVIVLDRYYPANDFLNKFPEPLFIVSPKVDGTWVIQTVKDNPAEFIDRKQLPEIWAGKRDQDLENVTGVSGSVFCQRGRFLAVAKTKEAILKLARLALK